MDKVDEHPANVAWFAVNICALARTVQRWAGAQTKALFDTPFACVICRTDWPVPKVYNPFIPGESAGVQAIYSKEKP
jgi:hypothetical protein